MDRQTIYRYLRDHQLAVLSTADPVSHQPESALIAFVEDEDLKLYFQTASHARKVANLEVNPKVSLVIGTVFENKSTLQYEGLAQQLTKPVEIARLKQRFIDKKSPTTPKYFNDPASIFFKVTPTWIGMSDYSGSIPVVIELKHFS